MTYVDARQALRHVCREVLGLSQPQTDTLVCTLEQFLEAFAERKPPGKGGK